MKSVLISIQPKWCEKICHQIGEENGKPVYEKRIEVRKRKPSCEVPFKAYIYATEAKKWFHSGIILTSNELLWLSSGKIKMCDGFELWADCENYQCVNGKVIGEFVCDKIFLLHPYTYDRGSADLGHRKFIQTFEGSSKANEILAATCLTQDEMFDYIGAGNYGYGWHISDLKIYNEPKELSEFWLYNADLHKLHDYDEEGYCCYDDINEYGEPTTDCGDARKNILNCYRCWNEWSGWCKKVSRPPQSWCYVEELRGRN